MRTTGALVGLTVVLSVLMQARITLPAMTLAGIVAWAAFATALLIGNAWRTAHATTARSR